MVLIQYERATALRNLINFRDMKHITTMSHVLWSVQLYPIDTNAYMSRFCFSHQEYAYDSALCL